MQLAMSAKGQKRTSLIQSIEALPLDLLREPNNTAGV
jgi:hypothetical protein